jgi:citrate/tricarballylate utilization protein
VGPEELVKEAERQLTICNACRYCEGYCAVFPALERLRAFPPAEVEYLANLCFDCRDCYYACQYAPPHEFAVNIPQLLAEVRRNTYRRYVSPRPLQRLLKGREDEGFLLRLALAVFALAVAAAVAVAGPSRLFTPHLRPGAFYQVIPYAVLVTVFLVLGAWWLASWVVAGVRFWRTIHRARPGSARGALRRGLTDALRVRYLGGEGAGCTYPRQAPSSLRRWLHQAVFFGFLLDFAATVLAAFYQHVLHVEAPYPLFHPVVVLGSLGGIGILVGGAGLLLLKARSDRSAAHVPSYRQDVLFLATLLSVALTGMLLLALRSTAAMGSLLALHLGTVAAFFLTAPYGKFQHALFRTLSLLRYHAEVEAQSPTRASSPIVPCTADRGTSSPTEV